MRRNSEHWILMSGTPKGLKGSDHAFVAACGQPGSTSVPAGLGLSLDILCLSFTTESLQAWQVWKWAMELCRPDSVLSLALLSEGSALGLNRCAQGTGKHHKVEFPWEIWSDNSVYSGWAAPAVDCSSPSLFISFSTTNFPTVTGTLKGSGYPLVWRFPNQLDLSCV